MELTLRRSTSLPVCTEQVLVAAARHGDDRAFEELYSRYRPRIFAFILNKVHDYGRAEDIAQEVFISALRRLRSSDQQISFKPWIYEIAKNACIDEFRRGSRSREVPLEPEEEAAGPRPMISLVPTPTDAVENKQRLTDLKGAFGGLSESHHELLVMREFEGLSYDEIGERLGMTRQMVESSLFRARRKLTEEYDELASGRRCVQIQTAIESGSAHSVASLGIRERRRIARHLAHCQACRHVALGADVDEALLKPRSIAAKIAALLPFPIWPWLRRLGGRHGAARAAGVAKPAGASLSLGPATAALATLALAGAGTGIVVGLSHEHGSSSSSASLAAAIVKPGPDATGSALATSSGGWPGSATSPAAQAATARSLAIAPGVMLFTGTNSIRQSASTPSHDLAPGSAPRSGSTASSAGATASSLASSSPTGGVVRSQLHPTLATVRESLHSTLGGVKQRVQSTVRQVASTVDSTLSNVNTTVNNVTTGLKGAAGQAVSGVTGAPAAGGAAGSTGSAGSTSSAGAPARQAPASAPSHSATGSQPSSSAGSVRGAPSASGLAATSPSSAPAPNPPANPVASGANALKSVVSSVLGH